MNLILPIYSIFLLALLQIVFYSKKRINSSETNIYKYLMLISTLNVVFNIMGIYTGYNSGNLFFLKILNHFDLPLYFLWASLLFLYLVSVDKKNDQKYQIVKKVVIGSDILFTIITGFLPFDVIISETEGYATGICVNFVYIISGIYIVLSVIEAIKITKHGLVKKAVPVFMLLILGIIAALIQKNIPNLIIIPAMIVFIELIMFFTIENPDIKLLSELHKSKEISDNANEEKTLFLYNMTQEIKTVTDKINDDTELILNSKDYDEIYDSARDIREKVTSFIGTANDILNMSSVDSSTIKVYNTKYNIKNIIKQIINIYNDTCQNKNLKFITNIDHDIPEFLYGDGIELKEVLTIILNNSVKYTNKGYVGFNVNTIIKGEICRLIITIEDSGIGIKSEEINNVKIDNSSLAKANKLISVMNGTLLISSDYGAGTKIKVILDQKIEMNIDKEIEKYEEYTDEIKLLAVDDSETGLKIIEKLTKGTNINLDKAISGKECINKIKTNKYDIVLLDEELTGITANDLILKLKSIRNYNTPVILLTKDNNQEYNEEYIKNGFVGYILKPIKKENFIDTINKHTKKD